MAANSDRYLKHSDFYLALSRIRAYRQELLVKYLEQVEAEMTIPANQIAVDWVICNSLERECALLEQLLKQDHSKR